MNLKIKKTVLVLICIFSVLEINARNYKPDFDVDEFINNQTEVSISKAGTDYIVSPVNMETDTALIFYPGGYVKYESYLPLLVKCAEQGILCIMPKMHHDLAIYGISSASKIISNPAYESITNWYIGGHSLGGAMASVYAYRNPDELNGLILLAAYSTKDISELDLYVLSVYGSNDGVLKMDKYEQCKKNLPEDFSEEIIEGGNHAGFGVYGLQQGDNPSDISTEEQIEYTAELIMNFIFE